MKLTKIAVGGMTALLLLTGAGVKLHSSQAATRRAKAGALPSSIRTGKLASLLEAHQWFELRNEVDRPDTPLLYKAEVEAAFNRQSEAERDLKAVISSNAESAIILKAQTALYYLSIRTGNYQEALKQRRAIGSKLASCPDIGIELADLEFLSSIGNQMVETRQPVSTRFITVDQRIHIPALINGNPVEYELDSGTTPSSVTLAAARRLRLAAPPYPTNYVVAQDVVIAGVHLRNVAFKILPAGTRFDRLPENRQGMIGLPVVLALRRFKWDTEQGTFAVLKPSVGEGQPEGNLALESIYTFASVQLEGAPLRLFADPGLQQSLLYPAFAASHKAVMKGRKQAECPIANADKMLRSNCVGISEFPLSVGGRDIVVPRVFVLKSNMKCFYAWFDGSLGIDALMRAKTVEFDFDKMTLSLR